MLACNPGEIAGPDTVLFLEIVPGTHGMNHVISRVHPFKRDLERIRVKHIASDNPGIGRKTTSEISGFAGKTAHPFALFLQSQDQAPTDVTACSRHQYNSVFFLILRH